MSNTTPNEPESPEVTGQPDPAISAPAEPPASAPAEAAPPVSTPPAPAPQVYAPPPGFAAPAAPASGIGEPPAGSIPSGIGQPPFPVAPPRPRDTRPRTLAIIALVTGIVGVLLSFIPLVNLFTWVLLVAALVLGIVALISKTQGGTGMSITAIVLSGVGFIVTIAVFVVGIFITAIGAAIEQSSTIGESSTLVPLDEAVPDEGSDVLPLAIDEVAFGRSATDPTTWWFVVIVDNPNQDSIWDYSDFEIRALDAGGTVIDTASDYRVLLSGKTAFAGDFLNAADAEIAEVTIVGPEIADAVDSPFSETATLTVADVQSSPEDDGTTRVSGTVRGDMSTDQEYVQITVVARDSGGRIIAGGWAYPENIPASGESIPWDVYLIEPIPEGSSYEVFASF